jgi:hypothetical protein
MTHMITKMENEQVYFVCSAQPKIEMATYGAPNKCPICRAYNPAPLDGREEVVIVAVVAPAKSKATGYSDASIVNQFVSVNEAVR